MLALATSSKDRTKIGEKSHVFWNVDFKMIFGLVLGRVCEPKTIDFRTFFDVFSMQNLDCNLEGQKNRKKKLIFFFPAIFAVSAALGGRIIGWGKGKFGFNFKPGLKIGL